MVLKLAGGADVIPSRFLRWYPEPSGVSVRLCADAMQPLAGLAQQVEQLPCKHQVVGSNPSAGTKQNSDLPSILSNESISYVNPSPSVAV